MDKALNKALNLMLSHQVDCIGSKAYSHAISKGHKILSGSLDKHMVLLPICLEAFKFVLLATVCMMYMHLHDTCTYLYKVYIYAYILHILQAIKIVPYNFLEMAVHTVQIFFHL